MRAALELAWARLELPLTMPERWLEPPTRSARPDAEHVIERVAFAIPRAAARVPWRATCLVQTLAAKHWLARTGIGSELKLGALESAVHGLDAHAWLVAGGRIVVGGDAAGYQPFSPGRRA